MSVPTLAFFSGTLVLALSPLPLAGQVSVHDRAELPPDVSTYAGIDAALEGRVVMAPDAVWSYFPGTENPSPKFEWAKENFDDSEWLTGAAPFGFGSMYDDLGTTLEPGVTSLYLRRTLILKDRTPFARVLLELPVDDGYVLFVNGRDEARLHADKTDTFHEFDGTSTSERTVDTPPCPTVVLTPALRDGVNTLALQVLTHKTDRESLAIYPRVRVVYAVTPFGEQARVAELRERLAPEGERAEARRSYLEGRHLQRVGKHADAVSHLTRAAELDPTAHAPWRRLIEAYRGAGTLTALDAELLERLLAGNHSPAMLDAWASFALEDLARSCVDFAARVPADTPELPRDGAFAEAVWSGRALAAGESLLIDCGATTDGAAASDVLSAAASTDGTPWGKDRCFGAGTSARAALGTTPRETVRVCSRSLDELVAAYRVPVVPGPYEVVLHFGPSDGEERSEGDAVFDVSVEDARVAWSIDPVAMGVQDVPSSLRFPVFVRDGFVDVDLLPRTKVDPWIAGLEIHPLAADAARFVSAAEDWVARTDRRETMPLVQLAEGSLMAGDLRAAFLVLEEAEVLPDFRLVDGERLARVRDALLPEVLSFATVDDLIERRADEAESILAAVQAAGESDDFASYYEARLHQRAGRIDDAIIGFEELVFGDGDDPLPVQRMVECMAADSARDAFGILDEALDRGVERTPALLQLWISLQIGPLGRDPWDVIDEMASLDVPDELVVVPTSEHAAREWNFTTFEPPANAWSRPGFDDSSWWQGTGMIGSGHAILGTARSHANEKMAFGRQTFTLTEHALLFPYFDVNANDAGECYLNGTLVSSFDVATNGYMLQPVRPTPFNKGENVLGEFGFNVRDASVVDVGITQPLGDLLWIKRQLDEKGALRINCGGGELTTADGKEWSRDRFFGWARASGDESVEIAGTEHDALYRGYRWFYKDETSAFHQIPLPNGAYHVTLYFAEIDERYQEVGQRVFDVRLEKKLVLDNLDIVAEVGFATALVREFDIEIVDGWFDLLTNDLEHRSFISAFEIEVVDAD